MTTGFAPKEVIEAGNHRLEVLSAETADTYGPQLAVKVKVVGGDHNGHQFTDYPNRDEETGEVKQGSKAWAVFEACLGHGFHRNLNGLEDGLEKLAGRQFMAQVTQTKTGSRNRLEHGTIGPIPPEVNGDNSGGANGSGGPGDGLREAQQQASDAASSASGAPPRDEAPPPDDADDPEWESIPF